MIKEGTMRVVRAAFAAAAGIASTALLLAASGASAQWVPGIKAHYFKQENVKQVRIALARQGVPATALVVYLDPPVNGDGLVGYVLPCPACGELTKILELAQLAQMFAQGTIKGVAYHPTDPTEVRMEMHGVHYDQPVNQKVYLIKGLYFADAGRTPVLAAGNLAIVPPSALPAPAPVAPATPKVGGTWRNNFGVTYAITQSGDGFNWVAPGIGQSGSGTIKGTAVSSTWKDAKSQGTVTGTIGAVDAEGTAQAIHWNNGIVLTRQ